MASQIRTRRTTEGAPGARPQARPNSRSNAKQNRNTKSTHANHSHSHKRFHKAADDPNRSPFRATIELLMQESLAVGWAAPEIIEALAKYFPKMEPEDRAKFAQLVKALLDKEHAAHQELILDSEGRTRKLYRSDGSPAMKYEEMGSVLHPVDNWTDGVQNVCKLYKRALGALAAAAHPDAVPSHIAEAGGEVLKGYLDSLGPERRQAALANLTARIAPPDGLALKAFIDSLPAGTGKPVHEVALALADRTREITGVPNGVSAFFTALDTVLTNTPQLKGITFGEYQRQKANGEIEEAPGQSEILRGAAYAFKVISQNVPATTAIYRMRKMDKLSSLDQMVTVASAAMITAAAFEKTPRQLYWLRMAGESLRAVTVETRTRLKWTRPFGFLRGLIRLAQALHPLIMPHIKHPMLKKFAAGLLITDLRVYQLMDLPGRPIEKIHEALRRIPETGEPPPELMWIWNTCSEEEREALRTEGTIPDWLQIIFRTSDQPIHDRLFGEWNTIAKVACSNPEAWKETKKVCETVLGAVNLPESFKAGALSIWCRWVKTLAGVKDRKGKHFTPYEPLTATGAGNLDRLEVNDDGTVGDVQGGMWAYGARPQPEGFHAVVEVFGQGVEILLDLIEPWLEKFKSPALHDLLESIKAFLERIGTRGDALPPDHRPALPGEEPKTFLDAITADRHPMISVTLALQEGGPHAGLRAICNLIAAHLPERERRYMNTLGDVIWHLISRPGIT